jgi:hypothetical protein
MENVLSADRTSGYLCLKDVQCELNVQYGILFWFPGSYFNCAVKMAFVFEEPLVRFGPLQSSLAHACVQGDGLVFFLMQVLRGRAAAEARERTRRQELMSTVAASAQVRSILALLARVVFPFMCWSVLVVE